MKRGDRKRERERKGGGRRQERRFEIKVNEPVRAGCTRRQFAFEGFPRPFNWNQIGIQLAPAPRDYARLMLDGALDLARETARELNVTVVLPTAFGSPFIVPRVLYVLPSPK